MKFLVNMTDNRGKAKIKIVEAIDVKEAELKAVEKYPAYEIGRITRDQGNINYYFNVKNFNGR